MGIFSQWNYQSVKRLLPKWKSQVFQSWARKQPEFHTWSYVHHLYVWHHGRTQAGHSGGYFCALEVHYVCTRHIVGWWETSGVPSCSSISLIFLLLLIKLLKMVADQWKNKKILKDFASTNLDLLYMVVRFTHAHFWWHCNFQFYLVVRFSNSIFSWTRHNW